MAGSSSRGLWRPVAGGCCLVAVIVALAAGSAAVGPARPTGVAARLSVRMLQLNLCDSGIAGCYSGRSVQEAQKLIRTQRPDVITLNEICRSDMAILKRALSESHSGAIVVSAFEAARDRRTASEFRCRNGQPYGIAVIARVGRSHSRNHRYSTVYPIQDTSDPEERVWLCLHAVNDVYACTTHLANTNATVALAQCRYLLGTALPAVLAGGGRDPMVLGGDFNLKSAGSSDIQSCVSPSVPRADDGGVQDIVAINGFTVRSSRLIDMQNTTDHPGLLVDLN